MTEYDLDMHREGHILRINVLPCHKHGLTHHLGQILCIECDFEDWIHCKGAYTRESIETLVDEVMAGLDGV